MGRVRPRTPKDITLRKIRELFGNKPRALKPQKEEAMPEELKPQEAQTQSVDQIADELKLPAYKSLQFCLQDIARELFRTARELDETKEIDPGQLRLAVRRVAAAYRAAQELFPPVGLGSEEAAKDAIYNPHRMKGEVIR